MVFRVFVDLVKSGDWSRLVEMYYKNIQLLLYEGRRSLCLTRCQLLGLASLGESVAPPPTFKSGGGEFGGDLGVAKLVSAILKSRSLCSSGGIGTPTTLWWEGERARPGGCADKSQLPVSMCHSQATHQLREAHAAQHSSQQRSMVHAALRETVLAVTLCEAYVAFSEQRGSPCEQPRRIYAE